VNDTVERLSHLLEEQLLALRSGQFARLSPLAAEMVDLAERLANEAANVESVRTLNEKAGRALVLVDASLEGMRVAKARIARAKRAAETLDTYDPQGRRHTLSCAPGQGSSRR